MNAKPRSYSKRVKENLISQVLADPDFKKALREAASEIKKEAQRAPNEATIESAFERIIYATLKDVGISFNPEKESALETRRHTGKGRADSRLGAVVIEYKQKTTLASGADIRKATSQLAEYISSLSQRSNCEVVGYLTDGLSFYEARAIFGEIISRGPRETVDENTLLRLTRTIVSLEKAALNPTNLIRDFCGDAFDGILFQLARSLNKILSEKAIPKTEMLRREWEELFRLAHEDQSLQRRIQDRRKAIGEIFQVKVDDAQMEYRALFALHTAYAIVLKLIAYRVVSDVLIGRVPQGYKPLTEANNSSLLSFCAYLEDGELFRRLHILRGC